MKTVLRTCVCLVSLIVPTANVANADDGPSPEVIKAAVAKSLPLLEKGAKGSMEQRKQCFNCHNQGLPIMALTTARSRGFEIDVDHLQAQLQFTADFLGRNKEKYREGDGQGGQVDTAGYALWTLDNGGWKPDDTTAAVAEYFLLRQKDSEHYRPESRRPPSEQSHSPAATSHCAASRCSACPNKKNGSTRESNKSANGLLKTKPEDTEDRVFHLRALQLAEAPAADIHQAAQELQQTQRDDGGWSQLADMDSDAYATGSALVTLHQAGSMTTDDPAYRKGLSYLLSTQKEDGSWYVKSRSKPFQTYFESGYPHGKDQFISSAAAGWSATALALALPKTSSETK